MRWCGERFFDGAETVQTLFISLRNLFIKSDNKGMKLFVTVSLGLNKL